MRTHRVSKELVQELKRIRNVIAKAQSEDREEYSQELSRNVTIKKSVVIRGITLSGVFEPPLKVGDKPIYYREMVQGAIGRFLSNYDVGSDLLYGDLVVEFGYFAVFFKDIVYPYAFGKRFEPIYEDMQDLLEYEKNSHQSIQKEYFELGYFYFFNVMPYLDAGLESRVRVSILDNGRERSEVFTVNDASGNPVSITAFEYRSSDSISIQGRSNYDHGKREVYYDLPYLGYALEEKDRVDVGGYSLGSVSYFDFETAGNLVSNYLYEISINEIKDDDDLYALHKVVGA